MEHCNLAKSSARWFVGWLGFPHPGPRRPPPSSSSASASGFKAPAPALSPRCFGGSGATAATVLLTGQSRFVEGSMNDRVSTAPPPAFLGLDRDDRGGDDDDENDDGDGGDDRDGSGGGDADEDGAGNHGNSSGWAEEWGVLVGRRLLTRGMIGGGGYGTTGGVNSSSGGGGGGGVGGGGGGGGAMSSVSRYGLRRPRSAAGSWYRSLSVSTAQQETQQKGDGGVAKKSSFFAPLWDGVREKLHLNKSKSSGSIGRVVSSMVGGGGSPERKVDREKVKERLLGREEKAGSAAQARPQPSRMAAYPSREEVLESYRNLMASGFFEAHAIRGGRYPLRTGGAAAAAASNGTRSFAEHMATSQTAAAPTGKSFADHLAAVRQQQRPPPALPLSSSPMRGSMAPPPLPPRRSSRGKPAGSCSPFSPYRGTKRGASLELASDAEMVTRKLVKKLRHSASRLSLDLTGARKKSLQYDLDILGRPRPSTAGTLSPTSSTFSDFTAPPSFRDFRCDVVDADHRDDDNTSIRPGRLTKPKDGGRRRILGLARRRPFSEQPPSAGAVEAEPDAMMIDEPLKEQQQQQQQQDAAYDEREPGQISGAPGQKLPRARRNFTPPPAAFLSNVRRSVRLVSSSESDVMSLEENDGETRAEPEPGTHGNESEDEDDERPLSVVPDPNQGIPLVPRIPRGFCDATAALAPHAPVVVAVAAGSSGEAAAKTKKKMEREAEVRNAGNEAKAAYRDSGLGEDVENIPVWGA
ncbi:hypothetical protein VTH06DRAFT_1106 [Thermothelomyces fergusii]